MESFQAEQNEEKGTGASRVSLHNTYDPSISECIHRCANSSELSSNESHVYMLHTVAQPGQNLVQNGVPQIHSAIPVPVVPPNGFAPQVGVPFSAPMGGPTASDPQAVAAANNTTANAPVIPGQMMPMAYPVAPDYSTLPDLRNAMASFFPRRSRRSQRHHSRRDHRSRRRSPSPSTESSVTESVSSSFGSPSSYDTTDHPRNHRRHRSPTQRDPYHYRSGSGRNPLPRGPKDVLASTPFRPLLSQLPSTYTAWNAANGVAQPPPMQMPQMPQANPAPPPRRERGIGLFRRRRDTRFAVPPLNGGAQQQFAPPGMSGMHMSMPDAQATTAPGYTPAPGMTPILPPVVPSSAQMQMRMPEPDQEEQPPVIPHGMGPGDNRMSMPSPGPPGSTPFVGGAGLMTPAVMSGAVPPAPAIGGPGMPGMGASPAGRPMSMPAQGMQMGMGMGMPSPGGAGGGNVAVLPVRFNGYGEHSGLLYHSPHRVMYQDELYPTALHLFEALKFLEHRPDLADRIRLCEHVEDVTAISASFADYTRRDWGNVALATVRLFFISR